MLSDGALSYWRNGARVFSRADDNNEEALRKRYEHLKAVQSTERCLRLAWAALGLALYGNKSVIPDILRNAPPLAPHDGTMQRFLIQVLVEILPLGEALQDDHEIRKNPKPLLDWYDQHQALLSWDSEQNAYRLIEAEQASG